MNKRSLYAVVIGKQNTVNQQPVGSGEMTNSLFHPNIVWAFRNMNVYAYTKI
jgi:hypothetical protein